jgi:hypothetical protein
VDLKLFLFIHNFIQQVQNRTNRLRDYHPDDILAFAKMLIKYL